VPLGAPRRPMILKSKRNARLPSVWPWSAPARSFCSAPCPRSPPCSGATPAPGAGGAGCRPGPPLRRATGRHGSGGAGVAGSLRLAARRRPDGVCGTGWWT